MRLTKITSGEGMPRPLRQNRTFTGGRNYLAERQRAATFRPFNDLKLPPPPIEFSKAGSFTKARVAGKKSFVFGQNEQEAESRLQFWN
jgi:hypothetical protein